MRGKVLKPGRAACLCGGRQAVFALLLAAGGAALVAGCVSRLALTDISHVAHREFIPAVMMGEMVTRGVGCVDCHEGAKTEERPGMPGRDFCMVCHEEMEDRDRFALGGPLFDEEGGPKWRVAIRLPGSVRFSHGRHAKERDCIDCHGDVANDDYSVITLAAHIENCRRCHAAQEESGECAYCHAALDPTALPHSHDAGWLRRHGAFVRDLGGFENREETCASCHAASYCASCHKEERPRDHTLFFRRAGHGLAADIDRERCSACHTEDRCVRCHLNGAVPRPPGHPAANCDLCHEATGHVFLTDNCMLCHK
jgi:hypothetical protein